MASIHLEPFLYLAGLTHDDALIAWGGVYFPDPDADDDQWSIVEDPELDELLEESRTKSSIGAASEPFGEATVEVIDLVTDDRSFTCSGQARGT